MTDLETLYANCTSILITPHNANIPSEVTIKASVPVKHPAGNFHYAEINVSRPTLAEALRSAAHVISVFKAAVESAP